MTKKMLELKERIKINALYIKLRNMREMSDANKKLYDEVYAKLFIKPENSIWGKPTALFIYNIRLYHIGYSIMRGRTYEQIENKVHDHNVLTESDWDFIEKIKKEYGVPDAEENVCAST